MLNPIDSKIIYNFLVEKKKSNAEILKELMEINKKIMYEKYTLSLDDTEGSSPLRIHDSQQNLLYSLKI